MFKYAPDLHQVAIKVIGIGRSGGSIIDHIMNADMQIVECFSVDTNAQALSKIDTKFALQVGTEITNGMGAGLNPDIGRQAAQIDRHQIQQLINGTDLLILTAGMGGGTGSGAIPVIASIAKDLGVLTVAVVTKPLPFEDRKRLKIAEDGLVELRQHVDSLIVVSNDKLITRLPNNATLLQLMKAANEEVLQVVRCISQLLSNSGLVGVDFSDIRSVLSNAGTTAFGSGYSSGEGRATAAARIAVDELHLQSVNIALAESIMCNISAGVDFSLREYEEVGDILATFLSPEKSIVIGDTIKQTVSAQVQVSILAAGIDNPQTPGHTLKRKTSHRAAKAFSSC